MRKQARGSPRPVVLMRKLRHAALLGHTPRDGEARLCSLRSPCRSLKPHLTQPSQYWLPLHQQGHFQPLGCVLHRNSVPQMGRLGLRQVPLHMEFSRMAAMEPGLASAQGSVSDSSKTLCASPEDRAALTPKAAEGWA